MAKINIINKKFLENLTGSLERSEIGNNKKLLELFELINVNINDNKIDIKELMDFSNSIFEFDDGNGEIDKSELKNYIKQNSDTFKKHGITARDIIKFFKLFESNADKTDITSQRINNNDGSYSLIYETDNDNLTEPSLDNFKSEVSQIIVNKHFSKDNTLTETEIHYKLSEDHENVRIFDSEDNFVVQREYAYEQLVTEHMNNGDRYDYSYNQNKTEIYKNHDLHKELITLENGQQLVKEYTYNSDKTKTVITTTNIDTGEVSKETIYDETYYIEFPEGKGGDLLMSYDELIDNPISNDTLATLIWSDKDIIKAFAKEDDDKFKQRYITGIINKTIEIAELCDIDSKELKNIQDKISQNGLENFPIEEISDAYAVVFERIDSESPRIEKHSKVKNEHYESENSYTTIFSKSKIVIINEQTGEKTVESLNKLLKPFNRSERNRFMNTLQCLPGEAILDLIIEVTFNDNINFAGSDGGYNAYLDKIFLKGGTFSARTILHELGHAIDCLAEIIMSTSYGDVRAYQSQINEKFKQCFKDDREEYIKAGNKPCIKNYNNSGEYEPLDFDGKNYATMDEQEMFAECYCLLMYGACDSQEVIEKYFKKTLECAKEILLETRKLSKAKRHVKN